MKKIMFNDKCGLTDAVLSGRKTQTRRVIALKAGEYVVVTKLDDGEYMSYVAKDGKPTAHVGSLELPNFVRPLSPKYFIGEVVAVAQSYSIVADYMLRHNLSFFFDSECAGWNNKMFVKAELMPHHIRITNVRVERLQDISNEDCLAEGIYSKDVIKGKVTRYYFDMEGVPVIGRITPRESYAVLIDKVSGKGTWESNPYVFVYDFELVD